MCVNVWTLGSHSNCLSCTHAHHLGCQENSASGRWRAPHKAGSFLHNLKLNNHHLPCNCQTLQWRVVEVYYLMLSDWVTPGAILCISVMLLHPTTNRYIYRPEEPAAFLNCSCWVAYIFLTFSKRAEILSLLTDKLRHKKKHIWIIIIISDK